MTRGGANHLTKIPRCSLIGVLLPPTSLQQSGLPIHGVRRAAHSEWLKLSCVPRGRACVSMNG